MSKSPEVGEVSMLLARYCGLKMIAQRRGRDAIYHLEQSVRATFLMDWRLLNESSHVGGTLVSTAFYETW